MNRCQNILRVLIALLFIHPPAYAGNSELIKLSDSIKEAQVSLTDVESHPVYETVEYQGICTKTEYREEYRCHTQYVNHCGNEYVCYNRPVKKCDRWSQFSFSLFPMANATEEGELSVFGGHDPRKPKPEQPRPDRPSPERPRPDHPRPDRPSPERPRPDHPRPDRPDRPSCRTEWERRCEYQYKCNSVPQESCGYESVPYEVSYSCTKYKQVLSHHETDFNVQGLVKVMLSAAETIGSDEVFKVALRNGVVSLEQAPVSTKNIVLITSKGSGTQIVKPDQGPNNPGLKQVSEIVEVGLIPVASLNAELGQKLVETKIQGNVLSFVLTNSLYADFIGLRLKLKLDRFVDKTVYDAEVPAEAVSQEKFGQSARISVDLTKILTQGSLIDKGKNYKIGLELSAVFPKESTVLNGKLVSKAVKSEIKVRAE